MTGATLTLTVLPGTLAVCRLPAEAPLPAWAGGGALLSLTRTADELSVVCEDDTVPAGIVCERGWRVFKVEGPLDFALTGILARLAAPLAEAGISIFALSTYDTDYLLVRATMLAQASDVLRQAGMVIVE